MKTSTERAIETRRAYAFEDRCVRSSFITKQRSLQSLRRLTKRVWKKEKMKCAVPTILFGSGVLQSGRYLSYCVGIKGHATIVLAKSERNYLTLLHELVHALGHQYTSHSTQFVRKAISFYVQYGRCNEDELVLAANMFGIRVRVLS